MKEKQKNTIVVYQAKSGALELRADTRKDTFWLTQQQIAELFDVQKAAISKHIKNIFDSGELEQKSTVSILETVQIEGSRRIKRNIEYYNLDLVLSIGYRVNSKQATHFRQWATKVLKEHITKGFTINKSVVKRNYAEFQKAIEDIKALLPPGASVDHASVLELVSTFADTWLSLQAYDKDKLVTRGVTKRSVALTGKQIEVALADLKKSLLTKGQATELFGTENRSGAIAGIVGNVMQSFGGKAVYPTVEEKAAHLLYFIVKNHPFVDGNKRCGAFAFVWFLQKARILDRTKITPATLTAITLFIAESDPKNKDRMVRLVLQLLKK